MNRLFTVLSLAFLGLIAANCNKDDGNGGNEVVNLRDRKEVREENDKQLLHYLDNNYMIVDGENITFDSITSKKYEGQPVLSKDPRFSTTTIKSDNYEYEAYRLPNGNTSLKFTKPKDELEYNIYYIIISNPNDGIVSSLQNKNENAPISTMDSLYIKSNTYSLKNELAQTDGIGGYFSFPITLKEFGYMSQGIYSLIPAQLKTAERQILTKVKTATNVRIPENGNGIYKYDNPGRIIAFIPSGVGYFNAGTGGKVKAYQPHIIDMTLITKRERDHDGDGILSKYESQRVIDETMKLGRGLTDQEIYNMNLKISDYFDFDTDGDGIPNFLDDDDDGDGVLTKTELQHKPEGATKFITLPYYDLELLKPCGTIYRYLDKSCFPDINKEGFPDWKNAGKK